MPATLLHLASFHNNAIIRWNCTFELTEDGIYHFVNCYSRCCPPIIPTFVKELPKQRRNYFLLNAIIVDLPRARTVEQCDASSACSERQMHGKTVASNQTSMILHISQMFQEGGSLR